ncbi:MAG: SagB/ThcOx family dehydrogenase [Bacteroidota bacterium]|nr:SagB/ThcOx family dehydrogenase [Bacteroidota bacterium]
MKKTILITLLLMSFISYNFAQEKVVQLPSPRTDGGMPVMKALKNRQTSREFSNRKVSDQVLSDLLWAGFGINRPDTKKRTAPSAMNYQETDVYVIVADGGYLYDAVKNSLIPVTSEDLRGIAGIQDFVKTAPVNIILVSDYSRMTKSDEHMKEVFGMADAAYVSGNLYIFCASEGLATGVRAGMDKEKLAKALKLRPEQHIMLGQAVGYFKE